MLPIDGEEEELMSVVSESTISWGSLKLKLSFKCSQSLSTKRDENDRVNYQCNLLNDPRRFKVSILGILLAWMSLDDTIAKPIQFEGILLFVQPIIGRESRLEYFPLLYTYL